MSDVPLKILIVDDTITYRTVLKTVIQGIPNCETVATAVHGEDALEKIKDLSVDIVLLDVEMPKMDGMETLRHIKEKYPKIQVIMVSGANRSSANITIEALQAGALDFVSKPDENTAGESIEKLISLLTPLFQQVQAESKEKSAYTEQVVRPTPAPEKLFQQATKLPSQIDVICIAVSTGGPKSLNEVIPMLPGDIGVPVLMVQHMPPVFTASLADSLDRRSKLRVKEAELGEPIEPNTVYIAPGGVHMDIKHGEDRTIEIDIHSDPPENSCRPAADVLFRSVAKVYGKNILAVVMTGMGSDGALGVQEMKKNGCYCINQTEETCVVYGMPRAIDEMGLADAQVDLERIAPKILSVMNFQKVGVPS